MNVYLTTGEKIYCSGCRSCEQVCTQNCVTIEYDNEGFLYPTISKEKCINCGLCIRSCPASKAVVTKSNLNNPVVYAAWNKVNNILNESSSGGVFSAIASYILKNNGVVFGCSLEDNLVAKHIGIRNEVELYKLRGSKYVQSDTQDTFKQVRNILKEGKQVFYTGTPCQIAGLKSFLARPYDNLITADLICHGVPSPKVFKEYLNMLEKKHGGKVVYFKFRDKEKYGWEGYGFKYGIILLTK